MRWEKGGLIEAPDFATEEEVAIMFDLERERERIGDADGAYE